LNAKDLCAPECPDSAMQTNQFSAMLFCHFGQVQEAAFSHESQRNPDGSEKFLQELDDDVM